MLIPKRASANETLDPCKAPPRWYLQLQLQLQCWWIECFHSRGQHLCKFIGTKESVCIRKEFNSHRTGLGHQHGRRFIVLGHQYGRRDVMWKHSIAYFTLKKKINSKPRCTLTKKVNKKIQESGCGRYSHLDLWLKHRIVLPSWHNRVQQYPPDIAPFSGGHFLEFFTLTGKTDY